MVNFTNGTTPAINGANLNKVQTDLQINIVTGQEKTTNITIGGKQVYVKRVDCGYAPNNGDKKVSHGLSNVTIEKIEGKAVSSADSLTYPLPFAYNDNHRIAIWCWHNEIQIHTWDDKSDFHCYVDLYYTKN